MKVAKSIALCMGVLLLTATPLRSQFYTSGTDPGNTRWSSIRTDHWKLIYPRGLDSLANCYAVQLERAGKAVGYSLGYAPNQMYRKPMPVILHSGTGLNNGMVTWAPRRMDIYCTPDAYDPTSLPVISELAIHEGRHVAQMQIGGIKAFRPFNVLIGEMTTGALAALYGGPAFLEGDAVATETALTAGGRGREADFLEYMRAAFDEGDMRSWWRWRYGSQRLYTPDHYRCGYVMQAGLRTYLGAPDFVKSYYGRIEAKKGWSFLNFDKSIKEATGYKLTEAFAHICDTLAGVWAAEADARRPYTPSRQLTGQRRYFTAYTGTTSCADGLYSKRSGLDLVPEIVSIDSTGATRHVSYIGSLSSRLQPDAEGNLWWSEYRRDPRWNLKGSSAICSIGTDGKKHTLSRGRRYYNPAPHEGLVAVCEYREDGSNALVLLDSQDGSVVSSQRMPDGFQLVECAWLADELYGSCLCAEGLGIYRLSEMTPVLTPRHNKIKQLEAHDGRLCFVSDRNGVDEVYSLDPSDGSLEQLSSSRIGSSEYAFCSGQMLVSQLTASGRMVYSLPADSLLRRKVAPDCGYTYPMAEELSRSEGIPVGTEEIAVSSPEPHSKFKNMLRVHSWLPVWFDYDAGASISLASLYTQANLGVTTFSQNSTGTLYGFAGVSLLDKDFSSLRPAGHLKFVWEGWYPVVEARLDFNERNRYATQVIRVPDEEGKKVVSAKSFSSETPLLRGSIGSYIPLYFNSFGWRRGIVPHISLNFTNDLFGTEVLSFDKEEDAILGNSAMRSRLVAGIRAYAMLGKAESAEYPRFGIGLNTGYVTRPGLQEMYGQKLYAELYGYLPGLCTTQGLRLDCLVQKDLGNSKLLEAYASILPRGMHSAAASSLALRYPLKYRLSADYAIPFASVDWAGLCPIAYVRNFVLTPFADYSILAGNGDNTGFWSAGADLEVVLGNLWCIPFDTRIGVSCCYNAGRAFSKIDAEKTDHFYAGFIWSIQM